MIIEIIIVTIIMMMMMIMIIMLTIMMYGFRVGLKWDGLRAGDWHPLTTTFTLKSINIKRRGRGGKKEIEIVMKSETHQVTSHLHPGKWWKIASFSLHITWHQQQHPKNRPKNIDNKAIAIAIARAAAAVTTINIWAARVLSETWPRALINPTF